jgi:hypothetical protein
MRTARYARTMNTTQMVATNAMIAPQIRYMDVLFSYEIMFFFPFPAVVRNSVFIN